ncbi:hypothetical protein WG902_08505 [Ramlibacter sp. PS3R-8]|uniref:hypothetical protein n=1 Tax=Ramlibacter sp. PS3R-8 TaxID=3133437 RepID=UPI003098AC15
MSEMPLRSSSAGPAVRLLCASLGAAEGSAVESLLSRRQMLLERAAATGIQTALLSSAGWVLQWLEGPAESVHCEWEQLCSGAPGTAPLLLHRSRGPVTLGEPVQVASLHAGERGSDVARRLHCIAREEKEGWAKEPLEIWRSQSAPCLVAGNGSAGLAGRRNVLALASEDNESVELVRAVAQRAGARLAYQRYAGGELTRGDVGAAYTDLPGARTAITRVQGLPRRALAKGVGLLGLGHVEQLVLLVGRERVRARAVMTETARLIRGLQRPPTIHLVSPCETTRELAATALHAMAATHGVAVHTSHDAAGTVAAILAALQASDGEPTA